MTDPSPGDFGLVHMGGDPGKLIRFAQWLDGDYSLQAYLGDKDDYEHAFLYLGNGRIIEAEPGGAKICDIHYDKILWSTGKIELTVEQRLNIVAAGTRYAGTPYSAADYYALAARRLHMHLLIPGLRGYVESSGHMICSQLVDKAYQDGGVQLFNDKRWNGYVTPGDLAVLLNAA